MYMRPAADGLKKHLNNKAFTSGRAKFVTGSVALLRSKPGGGAAWLRTLRDVPYAEAAEALCTLPGIGPKVTAETQCSALTAAVRVACELQPVDRSSTR